MTTSKRLNFTLQLRNQTSYIPEMTIQESRALLLIAVYAVSARAKIWGSLSYISRPL